jgi:beta-lactam-binding protein with PASTA domain
VVGLNEQAARQAILDAGIEGNVTIREEETADEALLGQVLRSEPPVGSVVEKDQPIVLVIAVGPAETTTTTTTAPPTTTTTAAPTTTTTAAPTTTTTTAPTTTTTTTTAPTTTTTTTTP